MNAEKRLVRRVQLAQEIVRIGKISSWPAGHHVTEAYLCERLDVSRSPVRAAMAVLEEWGLVNRKRNQGYFLRHDAANLADFELDVPTNAEEDLMFRVVRARLNGELPETVTQTDIMKHCGAARPIVSDVLKRMAAEGLVMRKKGRGWLFLPTFDSSMSLEHGYRFRIAVEPTLILQPGFTVDRKQLASSRAEHENLLHNASSHGFPGTSHRIDAEFHEMIAKFSGNIYFIQAVQNQNRLRRIQEYSDYAHIHRLFQWCEEHIAILDALDRNELYDASSLMQMHLTKALEHSRVIRMRLASASPSGRGPGPAERPDPTEPAVATPAA